MLFYRLILSALLWPWLTLRLAWRLWRGSPDSTLDERWMRDRPAPAHARRIWVHAASNGELTAVRAALLALLARAPGLHLVLTCNTTNGRDLVAGWADPRIDARLAPVDLRPILARFVDIFQPAALVIVENELWPERLLTCHGRGLPVLVIGARMGPKSHRLWSRLPALARRLMGTITWLAPQDGASRDRFADLGLPGHRIGRDLVLKSAAATAPMPAASSSGAAALPFARTYTVLAASTHEGEEEIVLDAFIRASFGLAPFTTPFNATGQPAASADAVSPPATENARGKLLAQNTATGPSGTDIERMSGFGSGWRSGCDDHHLDPRR